MVHHVVGRGRVVVTGMGAVTPLGVTLVETWRNLLAGQSGIVSLEQALLAQGKTAAQFQEEWRLASALPCQVAAPVPSHFDAASHGGTNTSRFVQLALAAASEAVASAGLADWWSNNNNNQQGDNSSSALHDRRRDRTGVSIGTGMSGVWEIAQAVQLDSHRKLSPHFVPKVLGNSAAARISLRYRLRGPNVCAATACAAGSHAIADAARLIQYSSPNMDEADDTAPPGVDIMLAGGTESCIDPWSLAGFCRLRAVSTTFNDSPSRASRPFDVNRDGFVMAEGAAVLVLEELEHARARLRNMDGSGTTPPRFLVELVGYGATADAYHITSPDPNGRGAVRAMQWALHDAGLTSASNHSDTDMVKLPMVGYVNAHATSTPMGDEIEMKAILQALVGVHNNHQAADKPVLVSSTKGATGHLLGAAGALEAAFTVQTLLTQTVPGTRNLDQLATNAASSLTGLDFVSDVAHVVSSHDLQVALSNSFGFGGTNSSLVFRRIQFEEDSSSENSRKHQQR
jgi:3-oxoacyl-[acyl-carrier-protein] synthase II